MISFFRRKKPDAAPPAESTPTAAHPAAQSEIQPALQPTASGPTVDAPVDVLDAPVAAITHPADDATAPPAAAPGKPGWRDRLRNSTFARAFGGLFSGNPRLDDDLLDEVETALLTADVGVTATTQLVESLRKRMKAREFADANALLAALRADLIAMLQPVAKPLVIADDSRFEVHHVAAAFDHGRSGREPTGNRWPDESQCNLDAGAVAAGFVEDAHRRLSHRGVDQGEEHCTVDDAVRVEMVGPDVEMGEPDDLIVNWANDNAVDVIVISTHGRSGLPRVILGSVTEKVLRKARCSVLAIPFHNE